MSKGNYFSVRKSVVTQTARLLAATTHTRACLEGAIGRGRGADVWCMLHVGLVAAAQPWYGTRGKAVGSANGNHVDMQGTCTRAKQECEGRGHLAGTGSLLPTHESQGRTLIFWWQCLYLLFSGYFIIFAQPIVPRKG